jgi:hypothetical protein
VSNVSSLVGIKHELSGDEKTVPIEGYRVGCTDVNGTGPQEAAAVGCLVHYEQTV